MLVWTRILVSLSLLLQASATSEADNWPRFRGPNGAGVASDADLPVEWSATKHLSWKVELPGTGNGSPIIWEDQLFLQTAAENASKRSLVCLDALSGKLNWRIDLPGGPARMHRKNSLASSTPATDGKRVCALFWDGQRLELLACDLKGRKLWQKDLGSFTGNHGAGTSPVLHRDLVLVVNDQDGSAEVMAFDAATGELRWSQPRKAYRASYAAPILRTNEQGVEELIVGSTAGVTAYAPLTGKELWHWEWQWQEGAKALRMVGAPIASEGMVFASTGDGGGARSFVALKPKAAKATVVWDSRRDVPYVPSLLVRGKYLFAVHDTGRAACFVAATGKNLWVERLAGPVTASPILVDGKIYCVDELGTTCVFPAEPEFDLLAKNRLEDRVFATPAVSDGRLYIRGRKHLYCISKE